MNPDIRNAFADTAFWIALIIKQDEHHATATAISLQLAGRITTTRAVLLETANALSRQPVREYVIRLIDRIMERDDIDIVEVSEILWDRAWELYCDRSDKSWSLTDCISILVMGDMGITDALTTDSHFEQAGFRALLKS